MQSTDLRHLCLSKISLAAKKDRMTMLHALSSQALTSIWMSLILKLFASDIIFANHNGSSARITISRLWL
ncbi:MAG: hypothetical protein DMG50_27290 [Acidobacteria bacterium]|nr:MAG: hypothetical protein DMG50_27290 [Acidobacteriota bacterium]